ncbi:MAG: hypothetical protein ACKOBJ_07880 [Actinomycetota bacterium]
MDSALIAGVVHFSVRRPITDPETATAYDGPLGTHLVPSMPVARADFVPR